MLKEHLNGYALALFSLAKEEKKLKSIKKDSKIMLEAILDGNEKITHILASKSLEDKDVETISSKSFKGLQKILINFINVVSTQGRAMLIVPTLQKLIKLINEELNIKEGVVYTTSPLEQKQITGLEKRVEKLLGYKPDLKNKLDPELISGFKIVVEDEVIEDSIVSRIHNIKYELLRGGN